MTRSKKTRFVKLLLDRILADGRSIYAIARAADISIGGLQRFVSGERPGITIQTAEALCDCWAWTFYRKRKADDACPDCSKARTR